ncbi:SDR family oxidoreductase [Dongia deserti]|uniref:SDR family oxidoreductase n=1 Tax=Dongia deserti TaxID=2268030 RepID=UPI000E65CADF|nr:SDR family oxidoreductase [Dongia deserti]
MLDPNTRNQHTNAIVTGGAQGIGFAIARQLAAEGCKSIAIAGRTAEKGARAVDQLKALGVDALFVQADVSKAEDCARIVATAIERFGTINGLVNAAATSARGSLVDTTPQLFDQIFNTNVRGPFLLMQGVVRRLLETNMPGSIVNILSMSAHAGQSFLCPYSSSKGALATMTKNVASAYRAKRIRCNAILPGWMDTPAEHEIQKKYHGASDDWLQKAEANSPMGQLVKPDQLAILAAYMLSPHSGLMTGALVDYDQNVAGVIGE